MTATPRKRGPYQRRADAPPKTGDEVYADAFMTVPSDLLALVLSHRDRIEGGLPRHRRRSKRDYFRLALVRFVEFLETIEPLVDTLAPAMTAAEPVLAKAAAQAPKPTPKSAPVLQPATDAVPIEATMPEPETVGANGHG